MKKSLTLVLSLVLVLTLMNTQSLKKVYAETAQEPVMEITDNTKESGVSLDELVAQNQIVSEKITDSNLNQLIRNNLLLYHGKANAMINEDKNLLLQSDVNALELSIKEALKDVDSNFSLNESERLINLDIRAYDKSTAENFNLNKLSAIGMIDVIKSEIQNEGPLTHLEKIKNFLPTFKDSESELKLNNYDDINKVITDAEKLTLTDYSPVSGTKVTSALASAKEALTIEISKEELILRTKTLNEAVTALESLILPDQKASMDAFIAKVKAFDGSKHSEASKKLIYDMDFKVKTFLNTEVQTLDAAERLLQEISQIETLMANSDIKDPVLVNKKELKTAVDKANLIKIDGYSKETWTVFQDKLSIAKNVLKNETVLQEMVNQSLGNLNQAVKDLSKTPVVKPVVHPFDDLPDSVNVDDVFTLSMGTPDTLKFDNTMFEVVFGEQVSVKALQVGSSQILFTASNGSIVKYDIEIKEKVVEAPKHDDETLVQVGISSDHTVYYISSIMIVAGLVILINKRKELFN